MATLRKLVVSLQADSAKLVSGLKKGSSSVGNFAKGVKAKLSSVASSFETFGKKIESIKSALSPLGTAVSTAFNFIKKAALGATAAVTGIIAAVSVKAGQLKEMQQWADSVGMSARELQKWQYAGEKAGLSAEKMRDVMKDVGEKIGEYLAVGTGAAVDHFERLGIKAEEFIGLAPDQAILKIGRAMEGLTQGEKSAFMEMLASDATLLLPLLENNAEALKKFFDQGERSGAFLSDKAIRDAATFSSTLSEMFKRFDNFLVQLTGKLSPALNVLFTFLKDKVIDEGLGGMENAAQLMAEKFIIGIKAMINGGIMFFDKVRNWGNAFDLVKLKILEVERSFKQLVLTLSPHKFLGENLLGLEFAKSDTERDLMEIEREIMAFRDRIAGNTVEVDSALGKAASGLQNSLQAAVDQIQNDIELNITPNADDRALVAMSNDLKKMLDDAVKTGLNPQNVRNKLTLLKAQAAQVRLGLADGNGAGLKVLDEVERRIEEVNKIAEEVRTGDNISSKWLDELNGLLDDMKAATDPNQKATEENTRKQDENTQQLSKLEAYIKANTAALEKGTGNDFGAVNGDKIFNREKNLKSSEVFERNAANVFKLIASGNTSESNMRQVASGIAALERQTLAYSKMRGIDVQGMNSVVKKMREEAIALFGAAEEKLNQFSTQDYFEYFKKLNSEISGNNKAAGESLTSIAEVTKNGITTTYDLTKQGVLKMTDTAVEAIKSIGSGGKGADGAAGKVNGSNSQKPEHLGEVSLKLDMNGQQITSKMFGDSRAVAQLKTFIKKQTNDAARGAYA